ncbi:MAG: hypothetical protein MJE68_17520 [Proteobacteria bacterium]|nr:hypothetical protein [Pseudomonadota bacterium]
MAVEHDPDQTYLLDSSVATLILDGELGQREPYTLLGHRKELRLQLEQTKMSLQQLETTSGTLKRSLAAYRFMKRRQATGDPPLLIPPTVGLELSRSKKVSCFLLLFLFNFADFDEVHGAFQLRGELGAL